MVEGMELKAREFERSRSQLFTVSAQKQQAQMQSSALQQALDELAKTKEKRVYKAVGNILIQTDTPIVKKELEEKKESTDLRVKTLQKQEDSLVNRLNKLKSELESKQGAPTDPAKETEKEEKKKPACALTLQ